MNLLTLGPWMTNHKDTWRITKEKILMGFGLGIIVFESAFAELIGETFHLEILIIGLALCGTSIAQNFDKR